MKSLQKTFDILEYVVLRNGASVTPTEVATALSLNLATATRILSELVLRGYLTHLSRKEGYIAGPMVVSLGTRQNPYERIAVAAREPITALSVRFRRQVNLAVWNLNRRIMLCYRLGEQGMQPWDHFFFTDLWSTATGRLLLSTLNERVAVKLVKEVPAQEIRRELAQIRKDGYIRFEQHGEVVIGCLVSAQGYPASAFGFGIDAAHEAEALEAAQAAAVEIRNILERPSRAY